MSSVTIIYEKSSVRITVTFKDFYDQLFIPTELYYEVRNAHGKSVISAVTVDADSYGVIYSFILTGDQLAVSDPKDDGRRFLIVYGKWDTRERDGVDFRVQSEFPGGIKSVLGT